MEWFFCILAAVGIMTASLCMKDFIFKPVGFFIWDISKKIKYTALKTKKNAGD